MDSLTGTHLLILAGAALVVALAAAVAWPARWTTVAVVVGLVFPAYALCSALVLIWREPKSNSVWFIGVGIACVLTLVPAFVGAGIGEMVGRTIGRRRTPSSDPVLPRG